MEKSIFTPLHEQGLTTLKLKYDWKTGKTLLYAAKEWDAEIDFSKYNRDFDTQSLLTGQAVYYNDAQVRELFQQYGLADYLEDVLALLKQGKHFGMQCYYNQKFNIRFMGNLHSRLLGINNRSHATLAGGIRRHSFEDQELDVIVDGLNLSRAMTYKNIAAEIPYGGSKTTIQMDELDLGNMEIMGFLAYCLDSLRTMTGPDMGFPAQMADVMNEHFSVQFTGGPKGPLGITGTPTAYGTYLAMKQAVRFARGTESLAGLSIAVQGLGAVGWAMCEYLLQEDVRLLVTDINRETVKKLIAAYPGRKIEYVAPDCILDVKADIFCPCAIGGIIHEGNIAGLKFDMIFGPANNQLKASSNEEEIRLSKLLAEKGILYQEAWWHNTGGVLGGAEEYEHGQNASMDRLTKTIERIVPVKTWENLNKARQSGVTPTESIYRICEEKLYGKG